MAVQAASWSWGCVRRIWQTRLLNQLAQHCVPVKGWADPIEAARPALFLDGSASSYMIGSGVAVDGVLAQL